MVTETVSSERLNNQPVVLLSLGPHSDRGLDGLKSLETTAMNLLADTSGRLVLLQEDVSCPASVARSLFQNQLDHIVSAEEALVQLDAYKQDHLTNLPQEYVREAREISAYTTGFVRAERLSLRKISEAFPGRVIAAFEERNEADLNRMEQTGLLYLSRAKEAYVDAGMDGYFLKALWYFRKALGYEVLTLRRRDSDIARQIADYAAQPGISTIIGRFGYNHAGILNNLIAAGILAEQDMASSSGNLVYTGKFDTLFQKLRLNLEATVAPEEWMRAMLHELILKSLSVLGRDTESLPYADGFVSRHLSTASGIREFETEVRTKGWAEAIGVVLG